MEVKNLILFMWGFFTALHMLMVWPMKRIKPGWWAVARQEWHRWLEAVRRR